jgi:hypothetical protein
VEIPSLPAELSRALLFRCLATEEQLIELFRRDPMIDAAAIARELDWPLHRVHLQYRKLTRRGVALPPMKLRKGRRVTVICPRCEGVRHMTPAWALRLKSHLCGVCNRWTKTKERMLVTCPDCGRERRIWPSAFKKLSHGTATRCRRCTLRVASSLRRCAT